jgi:hypothetical protein
MIIPVDVTLEQLRALTKAQIITRLSNWLSNNFTKRQLILWIMDTDIQQDEPVRTYRPDGQVKRETLVERDTETALQVRKRITTWTYYPTGEVNVITIKTYDASNNLTRTKIIKHYTDGKQPTVTEE